MIKVKAVKMTKMGSDGKNCQYVTRDSRTHVSFLSPINTNRMLGSVWNRSTIARGPGVGPRART
jgi:hypothetical protein